MNTKSAYTLPEWCKAHGISKPTFYRHKDEMPRTVKIGNQVRILAEDAEAWRLSKLESTAQIAA